MGEDGEATVLGVEVGGVVGQINEPLAGGAVGVATELGHGDGAAKVGAAGFVFNRREGRHVVERGVVHEIVATVLDNEAGDGAVKKIRGEAAGVHVGDEVGHGQRGLGVVQGEVDGAGLGRQADGDAGGGAGDVWIAQVVGQRDGGGGLATREGEVREGEEALRRLVRRAGEERTGEKQCPEDETEGVGEFHVRKEG